MSSSSPFNIPTQLMVESPFCFANVLVKLLVLCNKLHTKVQAICLIHSWRGVVCAVVRCGQKWNLCLSWFSIKPNWFFLVLLPILTDYWYYYFFWWWRRFCRLVLLWLWLVLPLSVGVPCCTIALVFQICYNLQSVCGLPSFDFIFFWCYLLWCDFDVAANSRNCSLLLFLLWFFCSAILVYRFACKLL